MSEEFVLRWFPLISQAFAAEPKFALFRRGSLLGDDDLSMRPPKMDPSLKGEAWPYSPLLWLRNCAESWLQRVLLILN